MCPSFIMSWWIHGFSFALADGAWKGLKAAFLCFRLARALRKYNHAQVVRAVGEHTRAGCQRQVRATVGGGLGSASRGGAAAVDLRKHRRVAGLLFGICHGFDHGEVHFEPAARVAYKDLATRAEVLD